MSKRKNTMGQGILIAIIGVLVFGAAGWVLLYKAGNPVAEEWAAKLGIGEVATIDNVAWVWERTERRDGSVTPAPSDAFVLSIISEESRVTSTTDCNTLMGSYLLSANNELRFGALASTRMYCEGSMESIYAEQLALVNSYHIDGGALYLNLDRDFGTMVFHKK